MPNVPELMLVRALTPSEPYAVGDDVSVAFSSPTVGRLVRHGRAESAAGRGFADIGLVPSSFSARVTVAAAPYAVGDVLTLSFVDPRFARVHRAGAAVDGPGAARAPEANDERFARTIALPVGERSVRVVRVRLAWSAERAKRFVQVVDKLFTVERLGWFRHVFAMRLLVPDDVDCGVDARTAAASSQLRLLRAATTETLGRPLLAAFMPNFDVTTEWLESVDGVTIARALAGFREALIAPGDARDAGTLSGAEATPDPSASAIVGTIDVRVLSADVAASVDACLAILVPSNAADATLSAGLAAYRAALVDAFAQTAHSTEAVRLGRMSEPNHVLDDRLWQLVGIIGETATDSVAASIEG